MTDKTTSPATGTLKSQASNLAQRAMGWALLAPGESVRWASGLSRSALAWGSLALAALLFISVNLSASLLFKNVKADLTEDRLYTISDGTRKVLSRLEEPVSIRVYYSRRLGEVAPLFARHFERLKGLLEQYRDLSGGRLQVTFLDPEPFSDAEDRAAAAGLKGQRLNQDGETGYFGLVASNTTDNDQVVPFFSPDRERFLEYDLTKLINGLANPKKRVVGLLSGVEMDGGMNPMNPRAQPTPAWMIMEQIRDFFEVRKLEPNVKEIPKDIDVLMVVQPTILTPDAAYAIDQYALSGGRVLAFVDPVAEASPPAGPMGMGGLPVSSDFRKILTSWGLNFATDSIVGDPTIARRVQFGGGPGGQPVVTDYLGWLQIDKAQLNEKDPLAASIRRLNLASAGALTKAEGATTIVQPLIETSARSGLIEAEKVRFRPDPLAIVRTFKSGGKPLMLAARIGGEAKSAYPDGRPKSDDDKKDADKTGADAKTSDKKDDASKPPAEPAKDTKDTKATDTKSPDGKAAADKPADDKAKAAVDATKSAAKPDKSHVAAGRVNVVVIADSDMLNDNFWVEVRDFLGQQIAMPTADNAGFVVNALENLSGGEALSDLRGRGVVERPFDKVVEIRRDAEQRFRQKEEALNAKLKDLQVKLANVETRGGEGGGPATAILSDSEKQAIEKFRSEMVTVRRELRDVKAALRRDIDRLDGWLKFFNIAAVPLLIGLGGLGLGLMQRRRRNGS
ncbi:MAG: Gldg family protein [Hyphomicrobiaceae bacterium]|nr:Gldg family protein [Hyphomicrobiaceae bacterium]